MLSMMNGTYVTKKTRAHSQAPYQNDITKLIKFDPATVLLFVQNSNECFASLEIENISVTKSFSYSVKTSNPKYYKVKEPHGVLKRGRNLIYFKMASSKTQERLKDKFRVEVVEATSCQQLSVDFKIAVKHQEVEYRAFAEAAQKQNSGSNMSMATFLVDMPSKMSTSVTTRYQSSSAVKLREKSMVRKSIRQKQTIMQKHTQSNIKTRLKELRMQDLLDQYNKIESRYTQILVDSGNRKFKLYIYSLVGGLLLGIFLKMLFFW